MKFLKPTGVCWWNCQKNPIDVLSRLLSNMKIPFGHAHPVLQLFVRFLFILFVDSYLVNNLVNVPIDVWESEFMFTEVRSYMSRSSNVSSFMLKMALEFDFCFPYDKSSETRSNQPREHSAQNSESINSNIDLTEEQINALLEQHLTKNVGGKVSLLRNKVVLFDSGVLKLGIRLNKCIQHDISKANDTKDCILCNRIGRKSKTRKICSVCKVPLCIEVRDGSSNSCFSIWHFECNLVSYCERVESML